VCGYHVSFLLSTQLPCRFSKNIQIDQFVDPFLVCKLAGKFSLAELYKRAGFTKEFISRGKYAELNADNRSFTPEEEDYFAKSAMHAYKTFRDKAALSRGLPVSFSNTTPLCFAKQGFSAVSMQRVSLSGHCLRWPLG
jgi:hypothetical protein